MNAALPWLLDLAAGAGPWLVYEAFSHGGRPAAGAGAALLVLALVRLPRLGEFKLLDGAILLFFTLAILFPEAAGADGPSPLFPLLLAAAAFGSVLAGSPFTLPYARRRVGPEWWDNRHFLRVNRALALAWGGCFLAIAALAGLSAGGALPAWSARLLDLVLVGTMLYVTHAYPRWYRLHRYLPRVRAGLEPYLRAPRAY